MIRVGVISDTHMTDSSAELPAKILDDFKKVDMIIHTGDLGGLRVLNLLKQVCSKVYAVRGNMDPEELRQSLPEKEIIKVGKHKIGVMHGAGVPSALINFIKNKFKNDVVDVVLFGHSHQPFNENIGGILYFNPGSPTDKIFAPFNSYGILELNDTVEGKIIKI